MAQEEFKIERGLALPSKPTSQNGYPFDQLEVGDSFVVSINGRTSWGFIFAAIQKAQIKHSGWKFTTRLLVDGSRRIWRTA